MTQPHTKQQLSLLPLLLPLLLPPALLLLGVVVVVVMVLLLLLLLLLCMPGATWLPVHSPEGCCQQQARDTSFAIAARCRLAPGFWETIAPR
jgi:hypothetical protein